MSVKREATMENIGGGVGPALFAKGLEQVLENMADAATSAVKQRKVKMSFTFKADEERHGVECEVKMSTELAQVGTKKAILFLSKDSEDVLHMITSDPKQIELADQLKAAGGEK